MVYQGHAQHRKYTESGYKGKNIRGHWIPAFAGIEKMGTGIEGSNWRKIKGEVKMAAKNPLEEIGKFALETRWEDLPPAIVHETKLILMDCIGCVLGAQTIDKGKEYIALSKRLGGTPEATIYGIGDKVSLSTAALINGELMFTLDFHPIMANAHDETYVLPTVLAFAENTGASGKELISAAALGFEISSRLGMATLRHPIGAMARAPKIEGRPRVGNAHSNFGAAAGAARLMKYNQEKTLNALGMAGHLCQVLTYGRWGAHGYDYMFKYGVPGWQSTGAVMAVLLADMGYLGDKYVLDADNGYGYFTGYSFWFPELITEEIGKKWWFPHRLHYKPYPCCGAFHCGLDCFYDILEANDLKPQEIESVKVYMRGAMNSKPFSPKQLENISAAQFSPPYVFSVLAHRITRGPEWHDKMTVRNPDILKFMSKVSVYPHPDYDKHLAKDPLNALSKCEVSARGKTFVVEREHRRGTTGTEAAATDQDLINKFKHNTERVLTQDKIDRAVDIFMNLEKLKNMSELITQIIQ
jgi:2-methylcitrate dehydratase PrpD